MRYMWLTVGKGKWAHKDGAEFLAKKSAGIDSLNFKFSSFYEAAPVELVDKESFIRLSASKKIEAFGILMSIEGPRLSASIGVAKTDNWSNVRVDWSHSGDSKSLSNATKSFLIRLYESNNKKKSPEPVILHLSSIQSDYTWLAITALAMYVDHDD